MTNRVMAVAGIAIMTLSGVTGAAYAATSKTTGGYAYNSGYQTLYACDTADDGHQIEAQGRTSSGARLLVRDSAGGGCSSGSTSSRVNDFRACRLEVFDTCGPYVKP